ncbi:hypothetical protein QTP88_002287 [Uroleucon formosanum]
MRVQCCQHITIMDDTTPLLQEDTCTVFTPSGVTPSWKPDDAIRLQHDKMEPHKFFLHFAMNRTND